MTSYVVGIDPGSTKGHGVATYTDGTLTDLKMCPLMGLYEHLSELKRTGDVIVYIEDVYGSKGAYRLDPKDNKAQAAAKGRSIGRCDWSQVEVERLCDYLGINVIKRPISSRWKKPAGKKEFELVTGWKGRSNEDTRSAAYFGSVAIRS